MVLKFSYSKITSKTNSIDEHLRKNTALLGILTVFTLFIIIWANLVELDEMSRVQGKIIPSSKKKYSIRI